MDTEAVLRFIKAVRQHFPTTKKTEAEEADWVRSMAYILRDYVATELAYAAEQIITTRDKRGFPLPAECLKHCAHARQVIKTRTTVANIVQLVAPKEPRPGLEIWRERDEEWRKDKERTRARKAARDA